MIRFLAALLCLALAACQTTGTPQRGTKLNPIARPLGPQAAKGAVLWMDGISGSNPSHHADIPTPDILHWFIPAGLDVYRLDLGIADQRSLDAPTIRAREAITALRSSGYRRVFAVGQSAGAFTALELVGEPRPVADGAIAFAPGVSFRAPIEQQIEWHRGVMRQIRPDRRVAVFHFQRDEIASSWHEDAVRISRAALADRRNAMVRVPPTVFGHLGFTRTGFASIYAQCLVEFLETEQSSGAICPP